MSLLSKIKGKGPSGFGYGTTAEEVTQGLDLTGKTYLITGSNSGIGQESARVLSLRGAHVIAAARSIDKAKRACGDFRSETTPVACELSEPSSIYECVKAVQGLDKPLDGIICNAGIMALPKLEQKFGYELQFLTNHIGHFILVTQLLEQLGEQGRVVMLSSEAHNGAPSEGIQFDNLSGERSYSPWAAYGQSKLSNLLFAKSLAKRFEGTKKIANSVHPGVIHTNLARNMNPLVSVVLKVGAPLVLKSIPEGAATQCYVATHPSLADTNGVYFTHCNVGKASKHGQNEALAERLWEESERIVAALGSKTAV